MIQACSAKTQQGIWEGMAQIGDNFEKAANEETKTGALPSLRYENSCVEDPARKSIVVQQDLNVPKRKDSVLKRKPSLSPMASKM